MQTTSEHILEINELIELWEQIGVYGVNNRISFTTEKYKNFRERIRLLILNNNLEDENWNVIKKYFLIRSAQFLTTDEYNATCTALYNLKDKIIKNQNLGNEDFWIYMHPKIKDVSRKKYIDGHYADAVETAFKEINDIVKKIHLKLKNEDLDGVDLMRQTFSPKKPIIILDDLDTQSGKNVQQEYMDLFAGAMAAIRNPKAHENLIIAKEDAIRKLMLASLLLFKLDLSSSQN